MKICIAFYSWTFFFSIYFPKSRHKIELLVSRQKKKNIKKEEGYEI
jgi:hypothetical protein